MHSRGGALLLDLHPSLGAYLRDAERQEVVRALRVPLFELSEGVVDLDGLGRRTEVSGGLVGLCVARGTLTRDVRLDGRVSSQLLVEDDLLLLDGTQEDTLPTRTLLSVTAPAHVAVLDDRLLAACRRWPRLLIGVFSRLALQTNRLHRAQAISQLPRVEDRILGLFWTLADHHGHVHPDGIHIDLPLTHGTVGQMIGAQRPTVTLGLAALADAGLLTAHGGEWIIDPHSLERFAAGTPLEPRRRRRSTPSPRAGVPADGQATVLLVSDALDDFDPLGLDAVVAPTEAAALPRLSALVPEVVVVHVREVAPPGFGERVVARVRGTAALSRTRIVVLQESPAGPVSPTLLAAAHDYLVGATSLPELDARVQSQAMIAAAMRDEAPGLAASSG